MITEPTAEMREFAEEYALWVISNGQKYLNVLSPHYLPNVDPMKIFIRDYYVKDWLTKK